jgi:hypothetical protein
MSANKRVSRPEVSESGKPTGRGAKISVFSFSHLGQRVWLTFLLAQVATLAGCSVIPTYPATLPELAPTNTNVDVSPDIAGRYADKGQGFTPDGKVLGEASLSALLQLRDPDGMKLTNADVVVITGPSNGALELQSFLADKLLFTLRRPESDAASAGSAYPDTYVGNRGFVVLPVESMSMGAGGIGGVVAQEDLWLRRAVDGSLIVLRRQMGAGVVVIVPVWGREDAWYRFPAVAIP